MTTYNAQQKTQFTIATKFLEIFQIATNLFQFCGKKSMTKHIKLKIELYKAKQNRKQFALSLKRTQMKN